MIRAVIFDCFGVLTTDGWLPFKQKHFGHDPELLARATDMNKQVDSGLSDYAGFLHDVAELAGVSFAEARAAIEDNVANDELFEYIAASLKPKYKLGLLSNAGGDWLTELFTPEQTRLFDAVSLSYQTGFIKPAERAYRDVLTKLGAEPEECVFVDDQERYCTAAAELGMHTVLYRDFEQCRAELEHLLAGGGGAGETRSGDPEN